jgi:hypothetical protein
VQEPRQPLDIRELAGDRFKVDYDKSAKVDRIHQSDVRFYRIKCKHGSVGTHSDRELSAFCSTRKLFGRLETTPTARVLSQEIDSLIVAFDPSMLDEVCDLLKARSIRTNA